jgi:hypothetical protein
MNRYLSPPLLFRLAALLMVILVIAGLAFSSATASFGPSYSLAWYTIDGGGGNSSGGTFTLMGTIGQPDAGSHSSTAYNLTGGFWAWMARYLIFGPIIRRP